MGFFKRKKKKTKTKDKTKRKKYIKFFLTFALIALGIVAIVYGISWIAGSVTVLLGALIGASGKVSELIQSVKGWFSSDS